MTMTPDNTLTVPGAEVVSLYSVKNYTFQNTAVQPEEDGSVADRMRRLQQQFDETGIRRSVDAVIVCHDYGIPCVLTLQIANDFFKLPGGYIDPSEDDVSGLVRHLDELFGTGTKQWAAEARWKVCTLLAEWYRPNFDGFSYPYKPAHVSEPKERRRLFLVSMPPEQMLGLPLNMKLLAIPVHEFYDNTQRYGPQLSALPHLLSRITFRLKA